MVYKRVAQKKVLEPEAGCHTSEVKEVPAKLGLKLNFLLSVCCSLVLAVFFQSYDISW